MMKEEEKQKQKSVVCLFFAWLDMKFVNFFENCCLS